MHPKPYLHVSPCHLKFGLNDFATSESKDAITAEFQKLNKDYTFTTERKVSGTACLQEGLDIVSACSQLVKSLQSTKGGKVALESAIGSIATAADRAIIDSLAAYTRATFEQQTGQQSGRSFTDIKTWQQDAEDILKVFKGKKDFGYKKFRFINPELADKATSDWWEAAYIDRLGEKDGNPHSTAALHHWVDEDGVRMCTLQGQLRPLYGDSMNLEIPCGKTDGKHPFVQAQAESEEEVGHIAQADGLSYYEQFGKDTGFTNAQEQISVFEVDNDLRTTATREDGEIQCGLTAIDFPLAHWGELIDAWKKAGNSTIGATQHADLGMHLLSLATGTPYSASSTGLTTLKNSPEWEQLCKKD